MTPKDLIYECSVCGYRIDGEERYELGSPECPKCGERADWSWTGKKTPKIILKSINGRITPEKLNEFSEALNDGWEILDLRVSFVGEKSTNHSPTNMVPCVASILKKGDLT